MDSIIKKKIIKFDSSNIQEKEDLLSTERALAIFIQYADEIEPQQLSITMRTPGEDKALVLGFLYNEGIISQSKDVLKVNAVSPDEMVVLLSKFKPKDTVETDRNFVSSASCGVCGKSSIEDAMKVNFTPIKNDDIRIDSKIINNLFNKLGNSQSDFTKTGGIHAVGLFDLEGHLLETSEDIGRHNALDKMIGHAFINNTLPLSNNIVLLSGRIGYELVQKSLMAGVPILVAIGAPTSLSYDTSKKFNQTLIGFLKQSSFNIYCGEKRIGY
ncbi:MAG: formate dehydrogenase accessory sulfurtransferase FdhD [Saprospiraceae bacterium]|nr:formate dehydrogenase accessory sulfurtransferase FdhD [Bacteroidia bacterium]NNE13356.1 formate dehydrogenase accessory sulfurtransferase FdhD [Saprospiraceae bacterium]NNL91945.1 formate dehydrogenase accessory sulfurtransferase FdhD [Saprospiraceae bacterium]